MRHLGSALQDLVGSKEKDIATFARVLLGEAAARAFDVRFGVGAMAPLWKEEVWQRSPVGVGSLRRRGS